MSTVRCGSQALVAFPVSGSTDFSSSDPVVATCVIPPLEREERFGLKITDAPVATEVIVHIANGNETIKACYFGLWNVGTGSDTSTFDLLINGVSALSAPLAVTHSDTSKLKKPASVTTFALTDSQVVTMKISGVTSAGGALGPFGQLVVYPASVPV